MKYLLPVLISFGILIFGCNKSVNKEYLQSVTLLPSSFEFNKKTCKDQLNYIPDLNHLDHTPIKYIRINFHVMCNGEGKGNFNKKTGRYFIKQVFETANKKLQRNSKMNLPPGNDTPIIPMLYQYALTGRPGIPNDDGIYFHNDEELYAMVGNGKHKNNYDKAVFKKYGIQKDTVINVFVMTHPIDSLKSKTYVKDSKGIGFSNFIKVTHWFEGVKDTVWTNGKPKTKFNKWDAVKLFNHEVGHSIGLRHTWRGNDGCEDTPHHSNCWNRKKGKKPCDEWWSNNFMDYNTHSNAWSPCQIGTIHRNFSDKRKAVRKFLVPNWCKLDKSKTIIIKNDIQWLGAKDLEGNLVIDNGGSLTIRCRLALPKDAKIVVHPKGKLIIDGATIENDCGDTWKGIEVWSSKDGEKGIVEFFNSPQILNVENEITTSEGAP